MGSQSYYAASNGDVVSHNLPQLLMIHEPIDFGRFEPQLSKNYRLLKAWESPLPLDQYLISYAGSVKALLFRRVGTSSPLDVGILSLLPALKLVVTSSAGVNHIDMVECRRRGISVTNIRNAYTDDVADMALALFIDVYRHISATDRFVRQGLWTDERSYPLGNKLGGKRVGIVGLGSIGLEVAKRLEAFGCIISYNSRSKKQSLSYPFYSNLCGLAANSDALIICCGLTDETRHMINKEVLAALGKEGVIVNVGRGAVVDEKDLVKSLMNREIRGAGLDVFENEPNVPKELFGLDNIVLSPHRGIATPESMQSSFEVMMANLEAFFSNKPLVTPVD